LARVAKSVGIDGRGVGVVNISMGISIDITKFPT
jgi:hypothetical protein